MTGPTRVVLELTADEGSDALELHESTDALRRALLDLDVERVEPLAGSTPPPGAKAGDAATVGALVVTLSPAVLVPTLDMVARWLTSRPVRTAKVTIDGDSIELSGVTRGDQRRLLTTFLNRHGASDVEPS